MKIYNSLYSEVINLLKSKTKYDVYVDMDGVICEYRYGEGVKILNGETSVYSEKRPIQSVIKLIKKYYKRNNFFILTSCIHKQQINAKKVWIKKYMPFFNIDNVYCILSEDFNKRIEYKVDFINQSLKDRKTYSILIEDTHEILKKSWENNRNQLLPVLVINLIK